MFRAFFRANYPLRVDQAQGLLRVLDGLIDLGDRRSAALEQTEAFKGIQGSSPYAGGPTIPRNNQFDAGFTRNPGSSPKPPAAGF
jgi:hypothetical protein